VFSQAEQNGFKFANELFRGAGVMKQHHGIATNSAGMLAAAAVG
jgi:hypothetical protein